MSASESTFRNTSSMRSHYQVLTTAAAKPGQLPKAGLQTTIQSSPTPIPYKTQRRLLMTLQSMLNESCFNFMSIWIPKMLPDPEARQCDPAGGSISLNVTPGVPCYQLPTNAMNFVSRDEIIDAFKSARSLRQACSQMSQITLVDVLGMLAPAMTVVEGLRNNVGASQIGELTNGNVSQVEVIAMANAALAERVAVEMGDICRLREELDKREQALADEVAMEARNQSALLSGTIDRLLDNTFEKTSENL
ncbi:hypothetical protein K456DRAFT_1913877 [Colletotrichum gloeosporioides 23]|nr:hypothetical protein K456DRAFT_1913877 [Colletotrichum gloeosporioides 23]